MVSIGTKIRRGEGWFWGGIKQIIKALLRVHLPVVPITKPLFAALYSMHVVAREMLLLLLRSLWYEPLFRSQCVEVGPRFKMGQLVFMLGKGTITLGSDVTLSGKPEFMFYNGRHDSPELRIGNGSFIGHGSSICVAESIRIGSNCLVAVGVIIRDYDGHPVDYRLRRSGVAVPVEAMDMAPVVVGDDVWIGPGATILKGVNIGSRSFVASGAVVTKDVPPDSVVAGNPARVVKELSELDSNGLPSTAVAGS